MSLFDLYILNYKYSTNQFEPKSIKQFYNQHALFAITMVFTTMDHIAKLRSH